jgi:protein-glucosylgalactosylhydroxylysine glucosidase
VERHRVINTKFDTLSSLTVGNGAFAYTVDATGLQSFPAYYKKGVPLGTQSEWGWHSFPNKENFTEEEGLKEYTLNGKKISYAVQPKQPQRAKEAADYFRINQHRLQLGNVGFDITKKNGQQATVNDIKNIHQELDPWTGAITSRFTVEDMPVFVTTYCNQQHDAIAAKIISPLLASGQIKLRIRFPYPTGSFSDFGVNYSNDEKHTSFIMRSDENNGLIMHVLDTTTYYVQASWAGTAKLEQRSPHYFTVTPSGAGQFECSILFSPSGKQKSFSYAATKSSSETGWKKFWMSGAAIDLSGNSDQRAFELERRVVLSQYLLKAQEAGNNPPQETGLTYNSWYGKPHMEMLWWHAAHYASWNRTDLLEKELRWYFKAFDKAKAIAKRQGFDGARWQKMTDNQGREVPSSVGAFLIWQQPHIIYFAEQVYQNKHNKTTLQKYKDLVFATANFMASFPTYNKDKDRYDLGKGLIPAQECFNAEATFNPTYELAYWSWALSVAQKWKERLGMKRDLKWDMILKKLAPLPQKNGVYLATESTPDCYDSNSKVLIDHPAVLAALSTIPPSNNLDTATMHRTYNIVEKLWHWDDTWGWDFPMIAMTAVRLQQPELAMDALFKNIHTNIYLPNGHNYQDERLTIYLPGNGGLLSAVAMMCAGYDGCKKVNPGFPKGWKVRWEGMKKMP